MIIKARGCFNDRELQQKLSQQDDDDDDDDLVNLLLACLSANEYRHHLENLVSWSPAGLCPEASRLELGGCAAPEKPNKWAQILRLFDFETWQIEQTNPNPCHALPPTKQHDT